MAVAAASMIRDTATTSVDVRRREVSSASLSATLNRLCFHHRHHHRHCLRHRHRLRHCLFSPAQRHPTKALVIIIINSSNSIHITIIIITIITAAIRAIIDLTIAEEAAAEAVACTQKHLLSLLRRLPLIQLLQIQSVQVLGVATIEAAANA
jgi:hypothetical protein